MGRRMRRGRDVGLLRSGVSRLSRFPGGRRRPGPIPPATSLRWALGSAPAPGPRGRNAGLHEERNDIPRAYGPGRDRVRRPRPPARLLDIPATSRGVAPPRGRRQHRVGFRAGRPGRPRFPGSSPRTDSRDPRSRFGPRAAPRNPRSRRRLCPSDEDPKPLRDVRRSPLARGGFDPRHGRRSDRRRRDPDGYGRTRIPRGTPARSRN